MPTTDKPKGNGEIQKTKTSQITTPEEKPFKPTRKMIRWFDATEELGYTASLTEIAKKSGIRRETWYYWSKNEAFVKWWDDQWQRNLRQNRWKLDAIGLKQAKNKYGYWKDMMNRTGNTIPEAGSIGQQFNTQLNIQDDYFRRITKRG